MSETAKMLHVNLAPERRAATPSSPGIRTGAS